MSLLLVAGCFHVSRLQDGGHASAHLLTGTDRLQGYVGNTSRSKSNIHGAFWFWQDDKLQARLILFGVGRRYVALSYCLRVYMCSRMDAFGCRGSNCCLFSCNVACLRRRLCGVVRTRY